MQGHKEATAARILVSCNAAQLLRVSMLRHKCIPSESQPKVQLGAYVASRQTSCITCSFASGSRLEPTEALSAAFVKQYADI